MIIYQDKVLPGTDEPDEIFSGYQISPSLPKEEYTFLTVSELEQLREFLLDQGAEYLVLTYSLFIVDDDVLCEGIRACLPGHDITYAMDVEDLMEGFYG